MDNENLAKQIEYKYLQVFKTIQVNGSFYYEIPECSEYEAFFKEIASLLQSHPDNKLKEFARWVIENYCFNHYYDDRITLEDVEIGQIAEKLGLIKSDIVTAKDVKNTDFYSKEVIGKFTIYRFTDILEEK